MLKKLFLIIALAGTPAVIFAQNSSLSVDPVTLVGFFFWAASPQDQDGEEKSSDIRNLWLCFEANMERNNRELGFGIFARGDRVALRTNYRFFMNKERQSGFFWGLYGHIEWRRMYWIYDKDNTITIGWSFPFSGDAVFHSIGATGGVDVGFRIRGINLGLTPFIGLGIPLFFCFGDLPPERDRKDFYLQNIAFRAFDIGIRIDFF
jgi:hypothetical protein